MPATVHTLYPRLRKNRDLDRAHRAGAAVRLAGGSAMDAALAEIDAAFNEASVINSFKSRVEHYIKLGTGHPEVRARYRARANLLRGYSLNTAILIVERWFKEERKAFQIASAIGRPSRLALDVLAELRLILRMIRANKDYARHFAGIRDFVLGYGVAEAAE